MKVIGVIGCRERDSLDDLVKVKDAVMSIFADGDQLVSGGCPQGGDRFAEAIAKTAQIPITIHYAKWAKHGKAAGFIRNTDIAMQSDYLVACVAPDRTGGTEDTIKKWLKMRDLTEDKAVTAGLLKLV